MARQLRLHLGRPTSYAADVFVHGESNRQARTALEAWPAWPGGCLVLVGAEGVGKSHLAHTWAEAAGAVILDREAADIQAAAGGPVLLEDVDRGTPDEALFHLINLAGRAGGSLLLTARTMPTAWPAELPDLRSRLNALFVAEIDPPCDRVLEGVLKKFFRERSIRPPKELYPYLLRRMGRSIPEARELVRKLDEGIDGEARPISRGLAREILDGDNQNLDLFE
jgi:chromosomal replication initiation ATPase DnaA